MQCWYFDKHELRNTPSHRDGMSHEEEANLRRIGARLLVQVAVDMNLPYATWASGAVFFHRFFMRNSFQKYDYIAAAACCLFLAGKVEETPKKCRDIVKGFEKIIKENELVQREQDTTSGRNTVQKRSLFADLDTDPKLTILRYERVLLQTIMFDLQVDNPYKMLLDHAKRIKGDKRRIEKVVQIAWTFINDSLCTTLCVEWEPEIIACSLLYLACRSAKFEIIDWDGREEDGKPPVSSSTSSSASAARWLDAFCSGLTVELAEEICHSVLDYYAWQTKQSQPTNSNSNSNNSNSNTNSSSNNTNNTGNTNSNQYTASSSGSQNQQSVAAQPSSNAISAAQQSDVYASAPTKISPTEPARLAQAHAAAAPVGQFLGTSNAIYRDGTAAGSSPKRPRRDGETIDVLSQRPPSLMNLSIIPPAALVAAPPQSAPPSVSWNATAPPQLPRFSAPAAFVGAPLSVEGLSYGQQFSTAYQQLQAQAQALGPQMPVQAPNAVAGAARFVAAEPFARREAHRGSVPSSHR